VADTSRKPDAATSCAHDRLAMRPASAYDRVVAKAEGVVEKVDAVGLCRDCGTWIFLTPGIVAGEPVYVPDEPGGHTVHRIGTAESL